MARVKKRVCLSCRGPMPGSAASRQKYCREACRTKAYRDRLRNGYVPPSRTPNAPELIRLDSPEDPPPWPHWEVPIAIVAHHSRRDRVDDLAESVFAEAVVMDQPPDTVGHFVNHLRAWSWLAGGNCPWSVVIEDDAVPLPASRGAEGFRRQLHAALAAAPGPVVSLYLGRSRPPQWQSTIARTVDRTDACFLASTHLLHGVGYAIRTELIPDMLQCITPLQQTLPIDEAVSLWCRAREHQILYTWPSLVDHLDGPTLIPDRVGEYDLPRRAWRHGYREGEWTSSVATLPTPAGIPIGR